MRRVIPAAVLYYVLVLGAGFAFGAIRVPFLVPALGERWAETVEAPFMFATILLAGRHIVRSRLREASLAARIATGVLALILMVSTEFTVVLWLRGLTLESWFAARDDVAGAIYLALLLLYAAVPALEGRR